MARTSLYSTAVNGNYSFLDEMRVHAQLINEQQIFSHFFMGRYKEDDVLDFYNFVESVRARFQIERRRILIFSEDYNSWFATDNNECFSVVSEFCKLLRVTLKNSMEIFKEFCKKKSHKRIYKDGKQVKLSVLTHSELGARYTQLMISFSDEEMISPSLKKLSNLLMAFFSEIVDVIGICKEVMDEELMILKDYPRLKKIYDDTIDELSSLSSTMMRCPDSIDQIEDSMTREMLQSDTDKWNEILSKYFHKRTRGQFVDHLLLYNAFKAKLGSYTPSEMKLWNGDVDKIKKVKQMIAYLDEKEPAGQKDKSTGNIKLSGKWVAMLMHWAIRGYDIDKKEFVDYFNNEYKGKYQKIAYESVMAAYTKLMKEDKMDYIIEFENFLNKKLKEEKKKTA